MTLGKWWISHPFIEHANSYMILKASHHHCPETEQTTTSCTALTTNSSGFSSRICRVAQTAFSVLSSLCLTLPLLCAGSHDRKLLNLFIHTCLILILHTDSACGVKKMDERSQGHRGVRVMMSLDLINRITQDTSHSKGHFIRGLGIGKLVGWNKQIFLRTDITYEKKITLNLFSSPKSIYLKKQILRNEEQITSKLSSKNTQIFLKHL